VIAVPQDTTQTGGAGAELRGDDPLAKSNLISIIDNRAAECPRDTS
jgi:hypothetical protein